MIGLYSILPTTPPAQSLRQTFQAPPADARPWVYWYFMDGNMTREGMKNDLMAMRKAGIGGAIFLQVDIGIPVGPIRYMSPEWQSMVRYAIDEAGKNGIQIALGTGPGWCGTGGPWILPEDAMQHLVSSETAVMGPTEFHDKLPQPKPRTPFFGLGSMTPELQKQWEAFYKDEVVLAVPTPDQPRPLSGLDEKSLVYRAPYSSQPGVKPYLFPEQDEAGSSSVVNSRDVIDLTGKMSPDGTLSWSAPPGKWTVMRFGRTLTGQTTRPAPALGLGFETDKFEKSGIDFHIGKFLEPIVGNVKSSSAGGLSLLHFDSWEMGSQNWSANFRKIFERRRGYDPLRFLPVMAGEIVDSVSTSERFLWDLRETSQELIKENHLGTLKAYGHAHGVGLSVEPYDMSPAADLTMGAIADNPQGEFWSKGFGYPTEYSIFEAASIGHTNGKPIVGAESFTADDGDGWLQHPGSMKAQTDWALTTGINRIIIHRYQHQPVENQFPGMTMGPYGVHWERTETWWNMVGGYHEYITRCQALLRQGLPVADVLYLNPEGAPAVFQTAPGSTIGDLPDHRGYNFDGCSPETFIERASVRNGRIVFPDGMSYRLLVLPRVNSMTPRLAAKIEDLVRSGATILGAPPDNSPSLSGGIQSDLTVRRISKELWSGPSHKIGKGLVIQDKFPPYQPNSIESAKWIWTHEGDPTVAAPVGKRAFTKRFTISDLSEISSASTAFTADNRFSLYLNDKLISEGTDFHQIQNAEVRNSLKLGENVLRAEVINDGDAPNPAGFIGSLALRSGKKVVLEVATDQTWTSAEGEQANELGAWNIGPWGLASSTGGFPPMFADYATTSRILREVLHTAPDLDSGDSLRYAHRRVGSSEVYFIANRSESPIELKGRFRVGEGSPEWWDPMTGETRPLPNSAREGSQTVVPLRLNGLQSGFVVFHDKLGTPKPSGSNFPKHSTLQEIVGPWKVSFKSRFGGPALAIFPKLADWSQSQDKRIHYYPGEATYRKTFNLKALPATGHLMLSLGEVKNIASVRLNGKDLGVIWCAPWQIEIPKGLVKKLDNELEVVVANLWVNRLIGDSKLPESQRVTKTTWSPYGPDSKLLSSGLLGPVKVLVRD